MTPTADLLIVEDDQSVREAVSDFLASHGLRVRAVADGQEMDLRLKERRPDLVVLDLMLPGEDGLAICRRLARSGPPVLVISALGTATDRIVGLELGAADYLAKPFEPRELLARVRAVIRRNVHPAEAPRRYGFGLWQFDAESRRLHHDDGSSIHLTSGEASLLLAFLERQNRILSRQSLIDLIHGDNAGPYDRAIDLAVSRLRRKIDTADGEDPIETVRGAGYRFRLSVRRA